MGLREELQADIAEAFSTDLKDAVLEFTCSKEIQSGDFDFETQTYPIVIVEQYSGRGVFGSYKRDYVKPLDYQAEDVKATVLQNEVSGVPQISDVWVAVGSKFKVLSVGQDPASVVWVCQLRNV